MPPIDAAKPDTTFDDAFSAAALDVDGATPPAGDDTLPAGDDTLEGGDATAPAGDDTAPAGDDTLEGGDDTAPAGDDTLEGGDDTLEGGDDTAPAGDSAPPAAPKTPPAESDDDLLARLAGLVNKSAPEPKEEQRQKEPAAEEQPPLYTDEEQQLLDNYRSEWPDVAKAEALTRRGEYQGIVNYVFDQIAAELQPMVSMLQTLSERTHLTDIRSAVEDYDDIRENVLEWVETEPEYLQAGYKHVIDNGTAEQVTDLVRRFRAATGQAAEPAKETPKPEAELPADTKKAVASLAPVSSKRTRVAQKSGPDDNDFEGAFAHFADKLDT